MRLNLHLRLRTYLRLRWGHSNSARLRLGWLGKWGCDAAVNENIHVYFAELASAQFMKSSWIVFKSFKASNHEVYHTF